MTTPPTPARLGLRYSALSDVGPVRRDNQDSGYAGPHLLAVADGVGGSARGDVASATAIEIVRRLDRPPGNDPLEDLRATIAKIHDRLAELVAANPELDGTSTTLSAAIFDGSRIALAHVGDSRAYLIRDGEISQITNDHTFVQTLVDEGRITDAEARVHPHRNLILRAVDGVRDPDPDLSFLDLRAGDRLLFCSDGASGVLEDPQLLALASEGDVDQVAVLTVAAALDARTTDNVTVVVAEVVAAAAESGDQGAMSMGPLLVGAAAEGPRLHPISDTTTGTMEPIEADDSHEEVVAVDPEELRYAPQPPRRLRWLRRLVATAIVGVLVWAGGSAAYSWTQRQYFVADSGGYVTIFRGVQARVPLLTLQHVQESSTVRVDDLPEYRRLQVRDGMDATSLDDARRTVSRLQLSALCEGPSATASATPTPKPTTAPTKKGTKKPAPSPSASPIPDPCADLP